MARRGVRPIATPPAAGNRPARRRGVGRDRTSAVERRRDLSLIVGKDETTIIEGAGKPSGVKERIAEIKSLSDNASSEYEKEQFDKRAAALSGKVAVIKVGGATETEIDEKKFRVDDAVAATKAALAEGIVAGGGVTLVNLAGGLKVTSAEG